MKIGFYPKFAATGIKANKRLYVPYILTCAGMSMMFYIIVSLVYSPMLDSVSFGNNVRLFLLLGRWVIAFFSAVFLFYTNSFLIRRRKKEFGLYNILGMGKFNIGRILICETLITGLLSLVLGLGAGILFSKFAELGLLNILQTNIDFTLYVSVTAIFQTIGVFSVIFALILLNSLRQIHLSDPLTLISSEKSGETPPKSNIAIALIGLVILGCAYYLAVSIKNPMAVMFIFLIAVIMVIIATYMLFISGSVSFCRFLQKRKNYYYKPNHFVSVSSMVYRMKRNGAGLASICILSTMVLVMLSSTVSLYIGSEDSLRARYPRDIMIKIIKPIEAEFNNSSFDSYRDIADDLIKENKINADNFIDYRCALISGVFDGERIDFNATSSKFFGADDTDSMCTLYFVSLEDYNRIMGTNEVLSEYEAFVYSSRIKYDKAELRFNDITLKVKKQLDTFVENSTSAMIITPSLFVIVPNYDIIIDSLRPIVDYNGDPMLNLNWYYGFNSDATEKAQVDFCSELRNAISSDYVYVDNLVSERGDFLTAYGGLFFLGIMLSVVFIGAAILIIYYKQVSEGYEDQSRFDIMQKVGMTKRDIRRSVNSQILTVFYMPIVFAGIHLAFAFPAIWRMLQLFNLRNLNLLILVTICAYLLFALFYTIVYRVTSNAYYKIVS